MCVPLLRVDDSRWEYAYRQLQAYIEEQGDARVKGTFVTSDGLRLGQWAGSQRQKRSLLPADKIARLEALPGWVWGAREAQWEEGFKCLQAFVESKGDALVPVDYEPPDGFRLGGWVASQRGSKRKDTISSDRLFRLEAMKGWVWDATRQDGENPQMRLL